MPECKLNTGSLVKLSSQKIAYLQFKDSFFRLNTDKQGKRKVDLNMNSAFCKMKVQCLSAELKAQIRQCRRSLWEEVMRWGIKHEWLLRIAEECNFRFYVRMLFVKDGQIHDYLSAKSLLIAVNCSSNDFRVPEKLKFCLAALYCVDFNKDSNLTVMWPRCRAHCTPYSRSLIDPLFRLWQNSMVNLEDKRRWFQKLCLKGFTKLPLFILQTAGEENFCSQYSKSDIIMLYLNALYDKDTETCKYIEALKDYSRLLIVKTVIKVSCKYIHRPAIFMTAIELAETCTNANVTAILNCCFSVKSGEIKASAILQACQSFNIGFISALIKYSEDGGFLAMENFHPTVVDLCRTRDGLMLSQVVDTICSVSRDHWLLLLRRDSYLIMQIACQRESACIVEILLGSVDQEEQSLLLDAAMPHFPNYFRQLCSKNRMDLIRVLQQNLSQDRWNTVISWDRYACAIVAAERGHLAILELFRTATFIDHCTSDGSQLLSLSSGANTPCSYVSTTGSCTGDTATSSTSSLPPQSCGSVTTLTNGITTTTVKLSTQDLQWQEILKQMMTSTSYCEYPMDVVHFLYFESNLRKFLETEDKETRARTVTVKKVDKLEIECSWHGLSKLNI